MKWIKKRIEFLNEAKIGELINKKQAEVVAKRWGKKYLDYEQIEPNPEIKKIEGTWKLTPEQKYQVLDLFFKTDVRKAEQIFENLPVDFIRAISSAVNYITNMNLESFGIVDKEEIELLSKMMSDGIDFNNIGIEEIATFTNNVLPRIDVKTTISNKRMVRDENGHPIKGEDGQFQFEEKEVGEFEYYSGLYNLNSFAKDYDECMKKLGREDQIVNRSFSSVEIGSIKNMLTLDVKGHQADIRVFHKDAYVSILHNPQDILNISVSKFYASCQELYGGSQVRSLLANVFDPNSVPAFIYLDSPVYNSEGELIAEKLPIARFFIRSIETPSETKGLLFDRVYPQRMSMGENEGIYDIVERVAGITKLLDVNDVDVKAAVYVFSPDISHDDKLDTPYMDTLSNVRHKKAIGINCRFLDITADSDWSDVIVRENNKIETMVISTPNVPANLFELNYNLEKLTIINIDISEMPDLSKFGTGDITLNECRTTMTDLREGLKDVELKRLVLRNCDIEGMSFEGMTMDELALESDTEGKTLAEVIGDARINKLTISDHLVMDQENVDFLKAAVASKQIGRVIKVGLFSKKQKKK